MFVLQVTKSEGNATGGDSAESLAEDLLKRFSDTQPEVKKEPVCSKSIFFPLLLCNNLFLVQKQAERASMCQTCSLCQVLLTVSSFLYQLGF